MALSFLSLSSLDGQFEPFRSTKRPIGMQEGSFDLMLTSTVFLCVG